MPFCQDCQREWDANLDPACPHCAGADEDLGATVDSSDLMDTPKAGIDLQGADITLQGDNEATPVWDDLNQAAGEDDATIASGPIDLSTGKSDSDPDAATIDGASATFGTAANPGQRRPTIRNITEAAGDPRTPTVMQGQPSSGTLGPGDSVSIGSENVRLRSHLLGETAAKAAPAPATTPLDYQHADGPWEGGMGQVWKSRQATLDRHVAIKQVRTENPSQRDRDKLVSEAVITGSLEHPNIIPVHDLGVDSSGLPFYSMKFVGGLDWDDAREQRDMSENENLAVLIQVSQAIAFAHSRGVIHMDLKPNNIRLGDFGEVLVMDWGLAARIDGDKEIEAGGTPGYMAPELAAPYYRKYLNYTPEGRKAQDSDAVDKTLAEASTDPPAGAHSDVYLLGALLYWIVTGSAPHQGKTRFKLLRAAARNEIAATKRRTELLEIAYKAMATEPTNRYADATDFIDAVKSYQDHAQSVEIARRASQELKSAERARAEGDAAAKDLYESYARARHGYENALALWPENDKAKRRLSQTRRVYGETAFANGDYDLALSLIEPDTSEDEALRRDVLASQKARNTRLAWYRTLQYATVGLLAASLLFIAISAYYRALAFDQIARAEAASELAAEETARADEARSAANQAAEEAAASASAANAAEEARAAAEQEATELAVQATEAAAAAAESRVVAEQANAARADAERLANEQRYYAAVASVRSILSEDGQYAAARELATYEDQLPEERRATREWKRLERLTDWQAEASELLSASDRPSLAVATPDGSLLLVAHSTPDGNELLVYHGGPGAEPRRLPIESQPERIALSADGRFAAIASPRLTVWDLQEERKVAIESGAAPSCFAFHPTKNHLVVGAASTQIEQWSIDDAGMASRLNSDGRWHRVPPVAVGYSRDGRFRWSADGEGVVRVWREGTDERPWSYRHDRVAAGSAAITCAAMSNAEEGSRLAYGCADGSVYELAGPWSEDDSTAVGASWIESTPQRLAGDHDRKAIGLQYALGGRAIVSVSPSEALVRAAPLAAEPADGLKTRRRYHDRPISSLSVVGDEAVTTDVTGRVVRSRIEVPETREGLVAKPSGSPITAVWIDPTGRQLAAADADGFVRLEDLSSGSEETVRLYRGHADHASWRAWRIDQPQPLMATTAADGFLNLWDAATGEAVTRVSLGGRDIVNITDSGVLIAAASGKPAFAQQLPDGERRTLWSGEPRVSSIAPLNGEATRFAVGLRDGQVFLWSEAQGRTNLTPSNIRPHWRPVLSMDYEPASGALLVGDSGGVVTRWRINDTSPSLDRQWRLARPHPVVRLGQSASGEAIAVQRWAGRQRLLRLGEGGFGAVEQPIIDAGFDGERLIGLGADGLLRVAEESSWRPVLGAERVRSEAPAALTGLSVGGGEALTFGPGFAQRWSDYDDSPNLLASVRSRPTIVACGAAGPESIAMLDSSGWAGVAPRDVSGVPAQLARFDAEIRAWAATSNPRRPLLALADGPTTDVIEWDLPTGEAARVLRSDLRGEIESIAAAGDSLAYIVRGNNNRRVIVGSLDAEQDAAIDLNNEDPVVSLAVGPRGRRVVVVYESGASDLAELSDGEWLVGRFERNDLAAATFTPDGSRLILGTQSGSIVAVESRLEGGVATTRRLMTFAGHSEPVHLLHYAADRVTLLSGDAAGGVATHAF